jgi:hypothetical protein
VVAVVEKPVEGQSLSMLVGLIASRDGQQLLVDLLPFEHHVSGEPMRRPRACLIPVTKGQRVLLEFARTGQRPSDVSWVQLHELDVEW